MVVVVVVMVMVMVMVVVVVVVVVVESGNRQGNVSEEEKYRRNEENKDGIKEDIDIGKYKI